MTRTVGSALLCALLFAIPMAEAQNFDITKLDPTSEGPWSDVDLTTVVVPQVVDGSITLDGRPSDGEYGGFEGVTVTPGLPNGEQGNAWILNWPDDREWDNPEDSSYSFWMAHDNDYLYIGVDVLDDIVNSDDPNGAFWRDDSLEIVTDVFNDNYDNNTDNSSDPYGGHIYVNYEGRISAWNDETDSIDEAGAGRWSSEVEYTYGEDGDIFGFGEATETGWNMEVRFAKRLFESEEAGNKLVEGERMGINFIMDDDDQAGTGPEGDASRTQDLELQYAWANRLRASGYDAIEAESYTEEELADELYLKDDFYDLIIDNSGRLSHGGTGQIIFGGLAEISCDPSTMGDIDGSGMVDFADFLVLSANFGGADADHTMGDIDCSGTVDFADFLVLSQNFGQAVGAAPVPEPSAAVGASWILATICLLRRRR